MADTPCDANDAPQHVPRSGIPPNFLGELDPYTGAITQVNVQGPTFEPQGMLFLPLAAGRDRSVERLRHAGEDDLARGGRGEAGALTGNGQGREPLLG